jgi:hypothetical protein
MGIQRLNTYEFRCDYIDGTCHDFREFTVPNQVTATNYVTEKGWQVNGAHVLCPKHRVDRWPVQGVDVRELVIGA